MAITLFFNIHSSPFSILSLQNPTNQPLTAIRRLEANKPETKTTRQINLNKTFLKFTENHFEKNGGPGDIPL